MQQIACTLRLRIISASDRPELGGAHRARERHEHLPAAVEVLHVGIGRVDERRAVEMPVVMPDEIGDCAHRQDPSGV